MIAEVVAAARRGGLVLRAEPGAGKTTRVPPALLDALDGEILVVEPRRIAARAAARRIATERGGSLGDEVGYHVRFDRKGGPRTRLWVMTEGMLLRRLQSDPFLEGVAAVVFDEFHERRLDADVALALCAQVRTELRPELALVVMSATMEPEPVAQWLGVDALRCAGRSYPIDVSTRRVADDRPLADRVAEAVREALARDEGDILVFLPGVREIRDAADALHDADVDVVALYGDLSAEAQDAALTASARRRVVLATNVAESSVTVPGVRVVIDSGLALVLHHDAASGLQRLDVTRISRASADQRAGRAGRLGPGRCVRLWTEREDRALADHEEPEVSRLDLAGPALQLLAWGQDPRQLRWYESPPEGALDRALSLLDALGARQDGRLSPLGRALAGLPLHPRLGRLVLAAVEAGYGDDGAWLAALLSERDPLRGWTSDKPSSSDLVDRLDAVRGGRGDAAARGAIRRAADQLVRALPPGPSRPTMPRDEALGRAVLAAWPDRVVRRRPQDPSRGRMVGGKGVLLRQSAVHDELFVAVDLDDGPEAVARTASAVDPAWLPVETVRVTDLDGDRVRARWSRRYLDLELGAHPAPVDLDAAAETLEAVARRDLSRALPTDDAWIQLRGRWAAAARWDARVPPPNEETLRELLPAVCRGRRGFDEVQAADWGAAARDALGWSVWQIVEALAPAQVTLPRGRSAAVDWAQDPPVLAVRIQDLMGTTDTPRVGPRVALRLHLLAPNRRVQQVTDDLAGFWRTSYPAIRKELRGRYPKHPWPEDPTAPLPPRQV